MEMEEYLKEYRALTLDVMEQINIDGNIKFLLDRREKILEEIKKNKSNDSEFREMCKRMKLVELDKEMNRIVKIEMVNIKKKLNDLKKRQQGNQKYLYSAQAKYGFLSKVDTHL